MKYRYILTIILTDIFYSSLFYWEIRTFLPTNIKKQYIQSYYYEPIFMMKLLALDLLVQLEFWNIKCLIYYVKYFIKLLRTHIWCNYDSYILAISFQTVLRYWRHHVSYQKIVGQDYFLPMSQAICLKSTRFIS